MHAMLGLLLGLLGPLVSQAAEPFQIDTSILHPSGAPAAFRQGTQGFRQLLHRMALDEPLADPEQLLVNPKSTLLIVLGDTAILHRVRLREFLREGGAVLIATDRKLEDGWATLLGARVDGRFVLFSEARVTGEPLKPPPIYAEQKECPLVLATAGSPLFAGIEQVATNRPSFLERVGRLAPMAQFPAGCRLSDGGLYSSGDNHRRCFAAGTAGDTGEGRVLVLADHSVFINDMLLREDNDNLPFAINCLTWVCNSPERKQVLFVEEDRIITSFQESLSMPLPPPEALTALINKHLAEFERERLFNKLALSALSPWIEPDQLLLAAIGLLTLMLVGYGFLSLGKKRHRFDKQVPRLSALLARQSTSAAVVELRHRAMLEEGNLWEAARALTRQCFDGALGSGAGPEMSQLAAEWGEPPRVVVTGGWWRRWQVGQQVRRLWQLAYDPVPVPVSPREFTHLAVQVRAVREALRVGTVRIEPP